MVGFKVPGSRGDTEELDVLGETLFRVTLYRYQELHLEKLKVEEARAFPFPLRQRQPGSFPPGWLILRRELLAGLDPERRIRRHDTIGIHVLVREVERIVGNDAAGELERCGIQREALDDVQLVAVGD